MNPFDNETNGLVAALLSPNEGRQRQASGSVVANDERFDPASPAFNPQLYENSPLSGSFIEQDYEANPNKLFSDRPPNLRILHEKPEHRVVLFLKAQGLSNTEIAKKTGYQLAWIGQVLRQPWARQRLVEELQSAGVDAVQAVVKSAALDSVWRLIDERDNEKAKPSERITAANSLLDRFLGKPTQHVETKADVTRHDASTLDDIDKRLADLKLEEARLTGTN